MFSIIKKTANVWHHTNDTQTVHLSTFGVVADITAQTFIVRALNGAFFPRQAVSINEIQVIDETGGGTPETFGTIDELLARLIQLQYPPYKTSGGGGGGAVDSVNGKTGVVVLDADDISDASTANKFVTASEKTAIAHENRSTLDLITEAFTTALKTAYDGAVAWIITNGANILNHISSTSNPHNTTASQVGAYTTGQVDTLLNGKENTITAGTTSQYYRGDKTFQALNVAAVSGLQTALDAKTDETNWVDISLTSTIVGWSFFTTRYIAYKIIGNNLLFVKGRLVGTSNATTATITIPFTSSGQAGSIGITTIVNNGVGQSQLGLVAISPSSNVIGIFRDNNATPFTSSGQKISDFSILIQL